MTTGKFAGLILVVGIGLSFTLSSCNSGQRRVQTIVPVQSPSANGMCGPGGCCSGGDGKCCAGGKCGPGGCCSGGNGQCCAPQGGWAGGSKYSVADGSGPTVPTPTAKDMGPVIVVPGPGDQP